MNVIGLDQSTYGQVKVCPCLVSANPFLEDSPGKAERHVLPPFPHSSGVVTAGLRGNSSDHPGFCLHAGTSHSAIEVRVKAKALCVFVCADVCACSSTDISSYLCCLSIPYTSELSTWASRIPPQPEYLSISSLHGSGAGRYLFFCRKSRFLNIEDNISCAPIILPQPSLLNTSLSFLHFSQNPNSPLCDAPALQRYNFLSPGLYSFCPFRQGCLYLLS